LLSSLAAGGGWLLSALHQLNAGGYAALLLLAMVAAGVWWKNRAAGSRPKILPFSQRRRKLARRFRWLFPFAFLLLALLAVAGGVWHAPNNYDALSYRVPRVLHWLAAGQWHWIHTDSLRLNAWACGFEWLAAPLLAFTKSDRWLFLINAVSFLLLPGLVFRVLRSLGCATRVAWQWMWLLPSGYGFVLQAGSLGSDLFAVVYALAAVDLALQARRSGRVADVWLSLLAAALLTGAKLSNAPLLLPWLIAAGPSLRLLAGRPLSSAAVLVVALLVSFAPVAWMNLKFCGRWTGPVVAHCELKPADAITGIVGNGLQLAAQNLTPPVFPFAAWWNRTAPALLPASLRSRLDACFDNDLLRVSELQNEEGAGLGFGLAMLLAVSCMAARDSRRPARPTSVARWVTVASVGALLAYMGSAAMTASARLVMPYYPLLVAAALSAGGHRRVVRQHWWQCAAAGVFALAVVAVVLTPSRPLWPARSWLDEWATTHPGNRWLARAQTVYAVYAERGDALAPLRTLLPPDAAVVGLVTSGDDPEASLWRPFGARRIMHVLPGDTPETLRARGIRHVVVSANALAHRPERAIEPWLARYRGELAATVVLTLKASRGPERWFWVRL
jgi:hypothetical protein